MLKYVRKNGRLKRLERRRRRMRREEEEEEE